MNEAENLIAVSGATVNFSDKDRNRFWQKVNKDGPTMPHMNTPCWIWTASALPAGYGLFHFLGKKSFRANRASWIFQNGSIPSGLCVLHKCDNPKCVNPGHLFVGTHADNTLDCIVKNRRHNVKGIKHPNSKLTNDHVVSIRSRYEQGGISLQILAHRFGVKKSAVWRVVKKYGWPHVP